MKAFLGLLKQKCENDREKKAEKNKTKTKSVTNN